MRRIESKCTQDHASMFKCVRGGYAEKNREAEGQSKLWVLYCVGA